MNTTVALQVLALFAGLSVVVGILVAVHDALERLLTNRSNRAARRENSCHQRRYQPLTTKR